MYLDNNAHKGVTGSHIMLYDTAKVREIQLIIPGFTELVRRIIYKTIS